MGVWLGVHEWGGSLGQVSSASGSWARVEGPRWES
jgi:hypothetical protein